ncbi:energy-coupled thiamine transporter ThiT [Xylocopilactobacillus apicola]|uniref:Thiamine transporter n=1 Tax=Xylocopilactobacillus apicola TaxID=2932184 RepID=A0AAU9CWD9_9LACO|nr:energy-coupled thiamine transporter ThiT [Xylocopilactobacillus apicola]BDR58297.1 thiamine transporter [Xylocopilactobacillus apicola]
MKDSNKESVLSIKFIVEDALFAALAMVLNMLKPNLGAGSAINISLGFVPIVFLALKRGIASGLLSGFIFGILDLFLRGIGSNNIVAPSQAFLEYILAFTAIGLAGLVHLPLQLSVNKKKHAFSVLFIFLGIFIGGLAKYFCHMAASAVFFAKYLTLPKHGGIWVAAFLYTLPSFLATFAVAAVCLILVYAIRPSLFEK